MMEILSLTSCHSEARLYRAGNLLCSCSQLRSAVARKRMIEMQDRRKVSRHKPGMLVVEAQAAKADSSPKKRVRNDKVGGVRNSKASSSQAPEPLVIPKRGFIARGICCACGLGRHD